MAINVRLVPTPQIQPFRWLGIQLTHECRNNRLSNSENRTLPNRHECADKFVLVVVIADIITEITNINDNLPFHQNQLTRFHSRSPPQISVHSYLQRLVTHVHLSPPILLSIVYYIDLLCEMYPAFTVSSLTVRRFLIASATVASQGLSDAFLRNKTYARAGGISPGRLAVLELEILFRVKWQVVPNPELLVDHYHRLVERWLSNRETRLLTSPKVCKRRG